MLRKTILIAALALMPALGACELVTGLDFGSIGGQMAAGVCSQYGATGCGTSSGGGEVPGAGTATYRRVGGTVYLGTEPIVPAYGGAVTVMVYPEGATGPLTTALVSTNGNGRWAFDFAPAQLDALCSASIIVAIDGDAPRYSEPQPLFASRPAECDTDPALLAQTVRLQAAPVWLPL